MDPTTNVVPSLTSGMPDAPPEDPAQRLAWRRPQLERLRLSLDTANTKGSGSDGMFFTAGAARDQSLW